jgi:hypothetical protein
MPGNSAGLITGLVIEALNSNFVLASYADAINSVKKITNDGGINWSNVGGNFEVVPISDFKFFGTNYTSTGQQGFGTQRTGGGTYVATNLATGAAGTNAGCISLTYSQWVKNFGMNAISTAGNHLAIARDMEFLATPQIQTGWIERTNTPNPTTASHWSCHPTYTAVHYYGVHMYSSSDIWLCGEKGAIITTRNQNGGLISQTSALNPHKEWFGHETGVYSNLYDIEAVNSDVVIAVGDNGVILRTNNASSLNNMETDFTVSVIDLQVNQSLQICPNPCEGLVNVIVPDNQGSYAVEILDASGKSRESRIVYSSSTEFDLTDLQSGIYIIQVINLESRTKSVGKIIKQ